jgi:hypothetical protein
MTTARLLVSAALAAVVSFNCLPNAHCRDLPTRPAQEEFGAEEARRVSTYEEADLAEANVRQALAEGKKLKAVGILRQIVQFREAHVKLVLKCNHCSEEPYELAKEELAISRARLAEIEGNLEGLVRELPGVMRYYERRIKSIETLLRVQAIETNEAQNCLEEASQKLQNAKDRLAAAKSQLKERARLSQP